MKIQRKTKQVWVVCLCMAMYSPLALQAQENDIPKPKDYSRSWYVGAQAGMPMAESTFSSFGADKFRLGWNAGIHGGYRINRVWSVEATANWGRLSLAEQSCCYDRGYFLGTDWNRYRYVIPEGMDGHYFKDLKSRVSVQRYGAQVNMNVLGFFNRTKDSRWRLELSPAVYAVGASSDLFTKADNAPVAANLNDWHLGYGGQAQVSYTVVDNINIGVYGGFTHLTGNPMDGMPELHSTNFIVDAGVKFSFAFGGKKKVGKSVAGVAPVATVTSAVATEQPKQEVEKVATVPVQEAVDSVAVATVNPTITTDNPETVISIEAESRVEKSPTEVVTESQFPVIYFSFNSVWIEPSERGKVKEIADRMKADKSICVRVTGWGDAIGGEEANKHVSLQRAEAVKRVLGQWLIPADRIETVGGGINRTAATDAEARNATTIEIVGKER